MSDSPIKELTDVETYVVNFVKAAIEAGKEKSVLPILPSLVGLGSVIAELSAAEGEVKLLPQNLEALSATVSAQLGVSDAKTTAYVADAVKILEAVWDVVQVARN